jgi:hypothetical protein
MLSSNAVYTVDDFSGLPQCFESFHMGVAIRSGAIMTYYINFTAVCFHK